MPTGSGAGSPKTSVVACAAVGSALRPAGRPPSSRATTASPDRSLRLTRLAACSPAEASVIVAWSGVGSRSLINGELGGAAPSLGEGLQPASSNRRPHLREGALHEAEVQGAHDVLVALGYLTERALAQQQAVPAAVSGEFRGEADVLQGRPQSLDSLPGVQPFVRQQLPGEVAAPLAASLGRGL